MIRTMFRKVLPALLLTAAPMLAPGNYDDKTTALLGRMFDTIGAAEQLAIRIDVASRGDEPMDLAIEIAAQRPNLYRQTITESGKLRDMMLNNAEGRHRFLQEINAWEVDRSAATLDALLARDPLARALLTAPLLATDGMTQLQAIFSSLAVKDSTESGGETLHTLDFTAGRQTGTMTIAESAAGVVLRGVRTGGMSVDFTRFDLSPAHDTATFVWEPPADSKKVDSLQQAYAEINGDGEEEELPLLGEMAPLFELPDLSGSPVSLASHRGKNIVVLDFWASWCGPCRRSMPILARVANDYASQGVVLYTVNLRENEATISKYMKGANLALPVLMDKRGTVSDQYGVNGIPHSVIIDTTGRIQAVHVGFGPGSEQKYRNELDSLLAGKSLVDTPEQ